MKNKNLNGIILAGGNSSRMGEDKATINYGNLPQYLHIRNLLLPYCDEVYISSKTKPYSTFPMLYDDTKYNHIGPMAGIMTAFDKADVDWLVIAVDYPLISTIEIEHLIHSQNNLASVFYNSMSNFFEPYLGLYRIGMKKILTKNIEDKNYSLQSILQENDVEKLVPQNLDIIKSINTKKEYNFIIEKYFTVCND